MSNGSRRVDGRTEAQTDWRAEGRTDGRMGERVAVAVDANLPVHPDYALNSFSTTMYVLFVLMACYIITDIEVIIIICFPCSSFDTLDERSFKAMAPMRRQLHDGIRLRAEAR